MVVSNNKSKFCLHYNRENNREGFLVCKDCGLILDETPDMIKHDPNPKPYTHIKHSNIHRSTAPLHSTTIGSEFERRNIQKLKRYSRLNKPKYTHTEVLKIKTLYETKRLLALLQLPAFLKNEIIEKSLFYSSQLPKKSKIKDVLHLTPFILYLTCLEKNIFIDKKKLFEFSDLNLRLFNRLFIIILRNNKNLQKKLRDNNFRKDQILNYLSGYIYHKKASNKKRTVDLILECLKQTPAGLTAKELLKLFNLSIQTISYHLKTLKNKGFIYSEQIKEGKRSPPTNRYKINPNININQDSYSFKELLETAQKILNNYWNLLKKYSNKAITSVIFSSSRDYLLSKATHHLIFLKYFTDRSIATFLSIEQSTLTSVKNDMIKLIKKIKERQNE